jgi:hypothetical protein
MCEIRIHKTRQVDLHAIQLGEMGRILGSCDIEALLKYVHGSLRMHDTRLIFPSALEAQPPLHIC